VLALAAADLRSMRSLNGLVLVLSIGLAAWALLCHGFHLTTNFVGAGVHCRPLARPLRRVARQAAAKDDEVKFKKNKEITAYEVRIVGEVMDNESLHVLEEGNEVIDCRTALARAQSRGLDLIMLDEEADPPRVVIAKYQKYVFQESKRRKAYMRQGKGPKVKEVKMSYTIGEHDLNTRLNRMEQWLANPRQQVKVTIQLKGRSRMFVNQARELLNRVRRETAAYGKVNGAQNTVDGIQKDGRGDLFMTFSSGADRKILKELQEEAKKQGITLDAEESDDDEEEEEEEDAGPENEEIRELEKEIKEMREELKDCGIKPGDIDRQPEMVDLFKELNKLKKAAAMSAGNRHPNHAPLAAASSIFVGGAAGIIAASLRPSGRFGRHR